MIKKFLSLPNLTLLVALSLSTIAAYYSIIGLTAIFAGAVVPVIIMGSMLEIAKITTTVWLRKYWNYCSWVLKLYLIPAVVALALLTSMGIFGFLSKAHLDQGLVGGDVQGKISIFDEKIKTAKENIDANRKALKQMDEAVDQSMARSTTEAGAGKAVAIRKGQAKERIRLQEEITSEQKNISRLNEERAPIAAEVRKVEAEVGPIKYIAALIYGDNPDANTLEAAVRWVIILLVIVFDPLAIALVLAANQSKTWKVDEEPEEFFERGKLIAKELDMQEEQRLIDEANAKLSEIEPNLPETIVPEEIVPVEVVETPAAYLTATKSFYTKPDGWQSVGPIVYTVEPIVEEPVKAKKQPKKKVTKIIEAAESIEPTESTEVFVAPKKPYDDIDGTYVMFEGRHMNKDVLKDLRPDLFTIQADALFNTPISTNFGTKFPINANKGDTFVRVDMLPNRVYKLDGFGRWIEVNKNNSDTYLHNQKYIEHLIGMIERGEYDVDLLSENEKEQIERTVKNKPKG